jgi:hypothetical protein
LEAGGRTQGFALVTNYRIFAQENVTVKIYEKCSADEEAKQHRALTTVPTNMRLALFIALPAAASPRHLSTDSEQCRSAIFASTCQKTLLFLNVVLV